MHAERAERVGKAWVERDGVIGEDRAQRSPEGVEIAVGLEGGGDAGEALV